MNERVGWPHGGKRRGDLINSRDIYTKPHYRSEFTLNPNLVSGGTHYHESSRGSRRSSPERYDPDNLGNVLTVDLDGRTHGRHRDLKRKMIFDLHHEIKKPIHTIVLEEISDIDRITQICMSTLQAMMENKVHRRYLHHMNNNNNVQTASHLAQNFSSNAGRGNMKPGFGDKLQIGIPGKKKKGGKNAKNTTDIIFPKLNIALPPSIMKHLEKQNAALKRVNEVVDRGYSEKPAQKGTGGGQESYPNYATAGNKRQSTGTKETNRIEEDLGFAQPFSETMAFKQKASLLSAKEALDCPWLRMSSHQIAHLESVIRAQGEDPGIHAHSDVESFDVFAEIRDIRGVEKQQTYVIKEESDSEEDISPGIKKNSFPR